MAAIPICNNINWQQQKGGGFGSAYYECQIQIMICIIMARIPVFLIWPAYQNQKMCGIWGCIGSKCERAEECTKELLGRGPEHIQVKAIGDCTLGFTRLAINGLTPSGNQPMEGEGMHWICNGEIYNWTDLRDRHKLHTTSESDCSVLGLLFKKLKNPDLFFRSLDGVFAALIYDAEASMLYVGRDPYGVRPLFIGYGKQQGVFFGSQIKSLIQVCEKIQPFLPSHWAQFDAKTGKEICRRAYHHIPWLKNPLWSPQYPDGLKLASEAIRQGLTYAVRKRLMAERPMAALLSGGIDSSLIAALLQKELKSLGKPALKTFSIGFEGSPDLKYAQMVAKHIESDHTEVCVTPDDFFKAIPEVIKAIESYDITSVRASVGNWMICREIRKRTECKVVFNGDGSDEVFGSYLYFKRAPSQQEFQYECGRLLTDIHHYDVLRSDRSISSHGLQARTPFLDKQFVAMARAVATEWRLRPADKSTDPCNQKWILRMAFDKTDLLPREVLWRRKQAFSDGVSSHEKSWYQEIQERVQELGIDWQKEKEKFTHLRPETAEAYYYRSLFDKLYGERAAHCIPYFWMPKWSGQTRDPSARTLSSY